MAFGFPAYHTTTIQSSKPVDETIAELRFCIQSLSWSLVSQSANQIIASTGIGLWSWGENISIEVDPVGNVVLTSKCVLPTQCFDWGKNRRNIGKIMESLQRLPSVPDKG